jgi:drug/metabolite transporter (DMT)-like permease
MVNLRPSGGETPHRRIDRRLVFFGAVAFTVIAWSSAFVAVRIAVQDLSPISVTTLRVAAAALPLGIAFLLMPRPTLGTPQIAQLIAVATSGVVLYNLLLAAGSVEVTAGTASVLVNTSPLFTALFAGFIARERPGLGLLAGMLVSLVGVAVLGGAIGERPHLSLGAALVLGAGAAQGLQFALQRSLLRQLPPLTVTALAILISVPLLAPASAATLADLARAESSAILAAVYLGIVPAFAGAYAWNVALRHGEAGRTAAFLYLVPFITLGLGQLMLGEVSGPNTVLGSALVVGGVMISQLRPLLARSATSLHRPRHPLH